MKLLQNNINAVTISGKIPIKRKYLSEMDFNEAGDIRHENAVPRKGKRFRSAFTTEQVNYLENEFKKFPYIGNAQRKEVATILNIPERAVKIWFQNRRMKEKKDGVNKEIDFDERINRKNVEFTNDQLNNMNTKTSINDQQQQALPLLIKDESHVNEVNFDKRASKVNFYKVLPSDSNQSSSSMYNKSYSELPSTAKNNAIPSYRSSAEFSIDLCKKYRNNYNKDNDIQNTSLSESSTIHVEKSMKIKEESTFDIQNSPEDLSCKTTLRDETESSNKIVSPSNLDYPPLYVANYPPYLSAGNMLWKPVNVMPVMTTGASAVTIPNVSGSGVTANQDQKSVKPCHCNCHEKPPSVFPENSSSSQAQYIITALPFQNYP